MLVPAFSPFLTLFSTLPITNLILLVTFILLSAKSLKLDWFKILLFGKELEGYVYTMTKVSTCPNSVNWYMTFHMFFNFTRRHNFSLPQIESICGGQIKTLKFCFTG